MTDQELLHFKRNARAICDAQRRNAMRFASAMDKVYYENFELLTAEEIDIIDAAALQIMKADCYDQMLHAALAVNKEEAHG